jgi:hypothetical protein
MMDEVFQFVATCKEYPPRSFPPSFNPANNLGKHHGQHEAEELLRARVAPVPATARTRKPGAAGSASRRHCS